MENASVKSVEKLFEIFALNKRKKSEKMMKDLKQMFDSQRIKCQELLDECEYENFTYYVYVLLENFWFILRKKKLWIYVQLHGKGPSTRFKFFKKLNRGARF